MKLTSPVDFNHVLKADFNLRGRPTGGHSLLFGDVRIIPGTESLPNAAGIYTAEVEMLHPETLEWVRKIAPEHTMFPKHWNIQKIMDEVNAAWHNSDKMKWINASGREKWAATTPLGVEIEGYLSPKATVFPKY